MKRIIQSDFSLRLSFIYENGKISALAMPTKQLPKQSKRPTLEVLQKFTNSYFKRNPPKVKWHRFPDGIAGDAVFKNNSIRLSLSMTTDNLGCAVGFLCYIPEGEIILEEGEQYFLYLLHEIGHFKITKKCRIKVPSEYKELKRILHQQGITKKGVRDPEKVISIIERYVRKHFEDEYVAGTTANTERRIYARVVKSAVKKLLGNRVMHRFRIVPSIPPLYDESREEKRRE